MPGIRCQAGVGLDEPRTTGDRRWVSGIRKESDSTSRVLQGQAVRLPF